MKITKYPQSSAILESNGIKILIDPGKVKFDESFLKEWRSVDAVFITHKHSDHCYGEVIEKLGVPIYSTQEVQNANPNLRVNTVKEGDVLKVGSLKVEVVKAVHGYVLASGEIKENVGFIVDDGITRVYFTSDTVRFKNDYKADVLFANVTAFDASMNLWGATATYGEVGAKLLVVAHQDLGKMLYDNSQIETYLTEQNINYIIPEILESFEV